MKAYNCHYLFSEKSDSSPQIMCAVYLFTSASLLLNYVYVSAIIESSIQSVGDINDQNPSNNVHSVLTL